MKKHNIKRSVSERLSQSAKIVMKSKGKDSPSLLISFKYLLVMLSYESYHTNKDLIGNIPALYCIESAKHFMVLCLISHEIRDNVTGEKVLAT